MREYQMRSTLWVVMEFCEAGSTLEATRTSKVLSADLKRHEAMIDAARAKGHGDVGEPVVVLLGAHQQICRSNCLPKLAALGIGVQRRSAARSFAAKDSGSAVCAA